ncbi:LLM class flavin-dependent oxidoreductase, partial [Nonomuraea lactucae]|uniref:LLM class flavin-dependent oxidoreductase n=1 Tax=Nonomuraea lactucae TaxID=2249762 RepID=UPI000DE4E8BB
PTPARPVPVLVGGDSPAALGRAARLGDGWIGNRVYTEEQLDALLGTLRAQLGEHGRTGDFEIIAPLAVLPDADTYRRFAAKGVTGTMAAPWWLATPQEKEKYGEGSLALKVATMERFAEEVIAKM